MKYNPDKHHRHSIRLQGYDYSQNGAYFVTLCAKDRECNVPPTNPLECIFNVGYSNIDSKTTDKVRLKIE